MPKETKEPIEKINKTTSTKKASKTKTSKNIKEEKTNSTKKKTSTKIAKATTKKSTSVKATKSTTEKKSSIKNSKTTSNKKSSTTKTSRTKKLKTATPMAVEYYDLPYKYNQTVVKVLYQNPTTLFVYWEISDKDIENYKKIYGDNFFDITKPVLIIHNDSMNYTFEIDINDFANCWYFNINDSKCNYRVELGRRSIMNNNLENNYIYISSSNEIESPNNKILFNTNEDFSVYFKNIKTNTKRKVNLPKILEQLNLKNKNFEFPIIKNIFELYQYIYQIKDVNKIYNTSNPSSGNPTSGML